MLFVQRADKGSVKRVVQLLASGSDAGKTGNTAWRCLQRSSSAMDPHVNVPYSLGIGVDGRLTFRTVHKTQQWRNRLAP